MLLLVGETFTKIVNKYDKVNAPLYGDAGTATLIEKSEGVKTLVTLYSDGSGKDSVIIKAGEARMPATAENLQAKEQEEGNIRSENEIFMTCLPQIPADFYFSGNWGHIQSIFLPDSIIPERIGPGRLNVKT